MATLPDVLADLKAHSTSPKQTAVIDAGIATEGNLTMITEANLEYVCVSRKRLKDYPVGLDDEKTIRLTKQKEGKG